MKYTMLGTTKIPQIAVGTWSWGTGPMGGSQIFGSHLQETDLKPVFDRALQMGCTLWDTAPVYGMGAAETILGHLGHGNPALQLSTDFLPVALQRQCAMERSLDRSLYRMGTDHAELFWIHAPRNIAKWTRALIPLLASGKLRYAGVCNHTLSEIKAADRILRQAGFRLAAVQNHYSLLYRVPEETGILQWCRQNGAVFFANMVLEQGALTARYTPTQPMPKRTRRGRAYPPMVLKRLEPLLSLMERIGQKHRADAAQIAIAWAIAKGTVPIVGMTKPHQVCSDALAVHIRLTRDEITQLEQEADRTGVKIPGPWEKELCPQ
ncbi:MAG: aldo/keto reductase [Oscillospiraceae bacterium]|nr:aldo/keto reductase [Oscillospiraceae bacterium]